MSTAFVLVNYEEMAFSRKNVAVFELSVLNVYCLPVCLLKWKVCNSFHTNVMSVGVKFRLFALQVSLCLWWRQCCSTVEVQPPACWSRALGRVWSGSRPGRFTVVKEPWIQFCRGWVGYRNSLNQWRTTCVCCRCLESNRGSSVVQSPYWLSFAGCLCNRLCGMELWQRAWCLALCEHSHFSVFTRH